MTLEYEIYNRLQNMNDYAVRSFCMAILKLQSSNQIYNKKIDDIY